jgi:hypothetical protein
MNASTMTASTRTSAPNGSASVFAEGPLGPFADPDFLANFSHRPFTLRHRLADHPLFRLPRLLELARTLPEDRVEYNAGDVPVSLNPANTPRTGLSVEETVRRIRDCRSWMALKNVELDSDYSALLDACLDQLKPLTDRLAPGQNRREGFIFLSSPGSITPYHIDPEHNFLLQISGRKTLCVLDGDDRAILSEAELEAFHAGGTRNLTLRPEVEARANRFELEPGDVLHIPITFPHWVRNGDDVSVSFSITFRCHESNRREILHRLNRRIRRFGWRPAPVGRSRLSDTLKFGVFEGARRIKRALLGPAKDTCKPTM